MKKGVSKSQAIGNVWKRLFKFLFLACYLMLFGNYMLFYAMIKPTIAIWTT